MNRTDDPESEVRSPRRFFARLRGLFSAGKGRPVAALILLWALSASLLSEAELSPAWSDSWPGKVADMVARPFKTGRQLLFDGYQRTFPRQPQSQPVTVVAIDEKSLAEIGQ